MDMELQTELLAGSHRLLRALRAQSPEGSTFLREMTS